MSHSPSINRSPAFPNADAGRAPQSSFSSTRADIESSLLRKAALESGFRQRLQQCPQEVWAEEFKGSDLANLTVRIFEDTDDTLYLVIPWHGEDFRQHLGDRPHDIWRQEFGTTQLKGFIIRILEEPTDEFYLVLPRLEALDDADFSHINTYRMESQATLSSPILRYLRIRRFTQWRHRSQVDWLLYHLQVAGLQHIQQLPIIKKLMQSMQTMRSQFCTPPQANLETDAGKSAEGEEQH
jgi:hypothetical protein